MVTLYSIFQSFIKQTKIYIQNVLPKKVSELTNDAGYLTSHQDISGKQDKLTFDTTPTADSQNPVTSDGIKKAIDISSANNVQYEKLDGINSIIRAGKIISPSEKDEFNPPTPGIVLEEQNSNIKYGSVDIRALGDRNGKISFSFYEQGGPQLFSYTLDEFGNFSGNAATATKAIQDASGNVITDTYPTKTGGGASGTWGINITGNAGTATKATKDGNGSIIANTYYKVSNANIMHKNLQNQINEKQDALTFDSTPTADSNNPVTSDGIKKAIDAKTVDLSNYYDKTQVDRNIRSATSEIEDAFTALAQGVQKNYAKKTDLDNFAHISDLSSYQQKLTFDNIPTANSNNPVTSDGIKTAIDTAVSTAKTEIEEKIPAITVSGNTISFGSVTIGVD